MSKRNLTTFNKFIIILHAKLSETVLVFWAYYWRLYEKFTIGTEEKNEEGKEGKEGGNMGKDGMD
jgi:hypothetical protein